jgi:anaerobic selenocysteine-containing dehydrogenase
MERRNFFKILSTVSAGMAAASCTKKSDTLIPMLVADHEIVPGEEQWHPSVCGECGAGCGTIVRIMKGERVVERDRQKFRQQIASIKKIEGNPLEPVSGGRLCARGQAGVQSLYNPDRVTGPLRRKGTRGSAEFSAASWDEAIAAIAAALAKQHGADASKILFLTRPEASNRTETIRRFITALNGSAVATCSLASCALERKAAEVVFGWKGLPIYDLAQARYVLGVGADFLGGWVSPVYYARQYGAFRQGRPGMRGRFVQAESRMSLTAASADEWLPIQPGSEPHFLTAITRVLLDAKVDRSLEHSHAAIPSVDAADLNSLSRACGIDSKRIERIARELGESGAPLVLAGASTMHTNSLEALTVAYRLNMVLGNIGQSGGMMPPNGEFSPRPEEGHIADRIKNANVLLLDGQNPVYTLPSSAGITGALTRAEMIVSFAPFIDDSAAYADWILPDHHLLESARAIVPDVSPQPAITVAIPFVAPLYDTRALEETLSEVAHKMNLDFQPVTPEEYVKPALGSGETWEQVKRDGGLWKKQHTGDGPKPAPPQSQSSSVSEPEFQGDPHQFPLHFQPYVSVQFQEGGGANLPWMQELPDPASSAMWGVPVEIDPHTAASLNVRTGDWVRVESPVAALEAPAYVHPAAMPGVLSMAIGAGHGHYGRYASGRGANPIAILAAVSELSTGTLAIGATRVRIARLEAPARKSEDLIQFSPRDREQGPWGYR